VPKHRAQRRDNRPGRRAPVSAAPSSADLAAEAASGTPPPDRPPAGRRGARPRGSGGRSLRSLLVTPWFAAGVGVLVAATVALEAPKHAVLSYGPVDPGVLCKNLGCASAAPLRSPGSLASAKPGVQLPPPAQTRTPAVTRTRTQHAQAAPAPAAQPAPTTDRSPQITIHFAVLKHGNGNFLGVITVRSSQDLGDWSLGFTIPGARISDVWGAQWQPSASLDGGIANGQPWPWPRPGPGMAKIVIFATGTPRSPTSCLFDGESCAFS